MNECVCLSVYQSVCLSVCATVLFVKCCVCVRVCVVRTFCVRPSLALHALTEHVYLPLASSRLLSPSSIQIKGLRDSAKNWLLESILHRVVDNVQIHCREVHIR